eukprot:scaffold5535_cov94-Phaeocystis_antarctica.AAC.1
MGEHYKDRWLFLSIQALKWVPRSFYTGHRGSQDSTNASGGDITDSCTKREIWQLGALVTTQPSG